MSLIERQAAIDALDGIIVVGGRNNAVRMMRYIEAVRDRLKQLPSAQPDLCDGCDRYGTSCVGEGCGKLEMPEVAKDINVPNNDCISRQSVIDAFSKYDDTDLVKVKYVRQAIEDLPSAQQEIIRCRDCKHRLSSLYCEAWNNSPGFPCIGDEMFCSMAERRTNERKTE